VEKVIVLGASDKPERYSYMAVEQLLNNGHEVIPVNTAEKVIIGHPSVKSVAEIEVADTLTVYVNPKISSSIENDILNLDVKRIIFNPGTENKELEGKLKNKGIEVLHACTLVMLRTGQF